LTAGGGDKSNSSTLPRVSLLSLESVYIVSNTNCSSMGATTYKDENVLCFGVGFAFFRAKIWHGVRKSCTRSPCTIGQRNHFDRFH
jgi:hypothetical protein